MKKKSKGLIIAMLCLLLCSSTVAFASSKSGTWSYGSNISAKVHGYIGFVNGPVGITDKVWYRASMYGADAYGCTTKYYVYKPSKTYRSGTINYRTRNLCVSGQKVSVGYSGRSASLKLVFNGKTKILTATD